MAAVGNYEVVFADFGPYSILHRDYYESIPAPSGKVVLSGGFVEMDSTTYDSTLVYPNSDGTELVVRIRPQSNNVIKAYAVVAEMG